MTLPMAGMRVLSMEQAAALPFATRHFADLGAEVIRMQSHRRGPGAVLDAIGTRNKLQLALDLSVPGGSEAFLAVADNCDVVAHNFTPRVVRKFGIDYEAVKALKDDVIYVSLTGFGTTGPWGERPLFGPGAEAMSGQNLLIGTQGGFSPGRPGTITYADNICGLNTAFAVLAALDERDRTGSGQHIDVTLYETAVSQIGVAVTERAFGAPLPERVGNHDHAFALHGVFDAAGTDRHIAIAATDEQLPAALTALAVDSIDGIADAIAAEQAETSVERLQAAGVAASVVADASDTASDAHLWDRGTFAPVFTEQGPLPAMGPAWGGSADISEGVPMQAGRHVGADTRDVLGRIGGLDKAAIDELFESGVAGELLPQGTPGALPAPQVAIDRGELARVDDQFSGWQLAQERSQ
ncbi:MAG TPA: CoA transferase [Dehalococcoidia bacterium]|nr:CoA transferase [Dehalococcoidia bacterium]